VHPIPPDGLYTSWDYNHGVVTRYYNTLKPNGVAIDGQNDDVGNVDGVFGIPAFFDAPDPTFSAPTAILNWEQVSGAGNAGSLVYIVEIAGPTTVVNPAVVPYYRDDACLDDGTGDDPVPRPWPGEASTDPRVQAGYSAANGGTPYAQLACAQKQGAWGAHGVHYFFSGDSDNAASPLVLTEIDARQWQFIVPTAAPTNVGQPYANTVILPLVPAVVPLVLLPQVLPPSAGNGVVATDQDVPATATLTGTDLDTCDLTFSILGTPAHGSVGAITNAACALGLPSSDTATITYTPAPGFSGDDVFTYQVKDALDQTATGTVRVIVRPAPPPTCANGPVAGCRKPIRAQSSPLKVKNTSPDVSDRMTWKWTYGAATTNADFGAPLATTSYQLCVYDGAGRTIARASAPAGGVCNGRPCWRETSSQLSYESRDRQPNGKPRSSVRLKLRPGAAGKAKIQIQGRGVHLDLAPLPATQPVTVQLKSSDGTCWDAVYAVPAQKNDGLQFRDKAE
jgi:hypothetical protein